MRIHVPSAFKVVLAVLIPATSLHATTINVTTTDDYSLPSACSLRDAITAANTNTATGGCPAGSTSASDLILVPKGAYYLSAQGTYWDEDNNVSGDLDVSSAMTIRGTDVRQTVIVAPPRDRVFEFFTQAQITVENMTLVGSDITANSVNNYGTYGGVFASIGSRLTLTNVIARDGRADFGGNMFLFTGPGKQARFDRVSVLNGKRRNGTGGGIYISDSSTSSTTASLLTNVTVSGSIGEGIGMRGFLKLDNVTLTGNDGGGVHVVQSSTGALTIANSIIAGNSSANGFATDLSCQNPGYYGSTTYSLIGTKSADCAPLGELGVLSGVDAHLSPAFDFGAGIPVHALLPGSPALHAGKPETNNPDTDCRVTDARALPRPSTYCDLGAYQTNYDATLDSTADLPDAQPGDGVCASATGSCTLRAAAMEAAASGGHWVVHAPTGTYALNRALNPQNDATGGDIDIVPGEDTPALQFALIGEGDADDVQIVGDGTDRVLDVRSQFKFHSSDPGAFRPVAFALINATVRGGHLTRDLWGLPEDEGSAMGGGIRITAGRSLLYNVVVRDNEISVSDPNSVGGFAGVFVSLTPELIAFPDGYPRALPFSTSLTMQRFAVVGNRVTAPETASGSGLFVSAYTPYSRFPYEPALLSNGTISGNWAPHGVGLAAYGDPLRLSFLTVTANQATAAGDWTDGAVIQYDAQISNSIIAGNPGFGIDHDCYSEGSALGLGYLFVGNSEGCNITGDTTGNLFDVDPLLGPLQTAPDGMPVHHLRIGSPALDAIPNNRCTDALGHNVDSDARGAPRPGNDQDANCTPGALEGDAIDRIFSNGFDGP